MVNKRGCSLTMMNEDASHLSLNMNDCHTHISTMFLFIRAAFKTRT